MRIAVAILILSGQKEVVLQSRKRRRSEMFIADGKCIDERAGGGIPPPAASSHESSFL